jgi:hypothetical protein
MVVCKFRSSWEALAYCKDTIFTTKLRSVPSIPFRMEVAPVKNGRKTYLALDRNPITNGSKVPPTNLGL